MITKFDSLYAGHTDLDQHWLWRDAHQRATLLEHAPCNCAEQGRVHGHAHGWPWLQLFLDGRASLPARRHRMHSQHHPYGIAPRAPNEKHQDWLRLQYHSDVAPAVAGGGLRHRLPAAASSLASVAATTRARWKRSAPHCATRRPIGRSLRSRSRSSLMPSTTNRAWEASKLL